MKRRVAIAIALVLTTCSFGFLAYWVLQLLEEVCSRWERQGFVAECVAPAGAVFIPACLIFVIANAVLFFLTVWPRPTPVARDRGPNK